MTDPYGVNLLPASGEWVYDTHAAPSRACRRHRTARREPERRARRHADRLFDRHRPASGAAYPGCVTVSLVVAWFGSSVRCRRNAGSIRRPTISAARPMPSGRRAPGRASPGAAPASPIRRPASSPSRKAGGSAVYGGTPSDPSVVRCIRDLKARGLRVTFYPFLLMDAPELSLARPHHATRADDVTPAASGCRCRAFSAHATPAQFTRDTDEPHGRPMPVPRRTSPIAG